MDKWVNHKMHCSVDGPRGCPTGSKTGCGGGSWIVVGWNRTGVGVSNDQSYGTSSTGRWGGVGMLGFSRHGGETRNGLLS